MIFELNGMVLVEVIGAQEPVSKLTMGICDDSVLVKSVESQVM